MPSRFSSRFGYGPEPQSGPRVRDDAPESVRAGFLGVIENHVEYREMRRLATAAAGRRPDPDNWSERNLWEETESLVYSMPWYRFYDLVEAVIARIRPYTGTEWPTLDGPPPSQRDIVADELNEIFDHAHLAWQIVEGKVESRLDTSTEEFVAAAEEALEDTGRPAAAQAMRAAIAALSERPNSNTRQAVREALGALEALERDRTGRSGTLDDILRENAEDIHPALREGLRKLWGYSSDVARHVDEEREPTMSEATAVVAIASGIICALML